MIWNAEKNIQLRPAEGTSGESSICVPTSAGCFIGVNMKIEKRCIRCKETKSISEFNKNQSSKDGLRGYCKSCQRISDRNYNKTAKGKVVHIEAQKKYQKTEKGKAVHRKANERLDMRCPNASKARNAVNNAIKAGKLPRPNTFICSDVECFKQAQLYHHDSYEPKRWFDVIPLCATCHMKRYKKIA